jgi:hypothetical protein
VRQDDLLDWLVRTVPRTVPVTKTATKPGRRNKRDRCAMTIKAMWPSRRPPRAELPDGVLCKQVVNWLKADCEKRNIPFVSIDNGTILRACGRKE